MGNQVCCQDLREETNPIEKIESVNIVSSQPAEQKLVDEQPNKIQPLHQQLKSNVQPPIALPQLNPSVRQTYDKHLFFQNDFNSLNPTRRRYGNDVYQGEINKQNQKPHGLGKIYKNDGSIYIGYFNNGKAQGKVVFIFGDGSYYLGGFVNNKADCQDGYYESENIKYTGGFKQNNFQGKGKQIGKSFIFEGQLVKGRRLKGLLKWQGSNGFSYQYNGTFNQNDQFHGQGVLIDQKGIYKGSFVNGLRQGSGEYKGENGVVYIGQYKADKKDGFGTIYNDDSTISYRGNFLNGLPHGKGSIFKGKREIVAEFFQGIDVRQLKSVIEQ